jgi:hypothetical protein
MVNIVDLRNLKWWDSLILGLTFPSPITLSVAFGKPMVLLLNFLEYAHTVIPAQFILLLTANFVVLILGDRHYSILVARMWLRDGSAECELMYEPFSL